MFAHCQHYIRDIGIITSKSIIHHTNNINLAVHDVTGHGSRSNIDLEYENDEIKDGDWKQLQKQVKWYPIPNIYAVGTLYLKTN